MTRPSAARLILRVSLAITLAGCAAAPSPSAPASADVPASISSPSATTTARHFPTEAFAALGDQPVPDALASKLQAVLETAANGKGLTAALLSPQGTWTGATGKATAEQAMVPEDQMPIGSITKTVVAAQVMQLVEAGKLRLDDRAEDHLPPDLDFKTNGETVENLLSHRSGFLSDTVLDPKDIERIEKDPSHAWTLKELLATVGPARGPIGTTWDYKGVTYVLLGQVIEHETGLTLAQALRRRVLAGDAYKRLIFQPEERPAEPIAMMEAASIDTLKEVGGYLPSLAWATVGNAEGAMASDSITLARWYRALCAGKVVSQASVDQMTDFEKLPEYALGLWDRRPEYGAPSGALGHTGANHALALCFQDPVMVVTVISNEREHDVDTTAGNLWNAASGGAI